MSIIKNRKKSGTAALGAAAAVAPAVVIPLLLFGPGIAPAYADGMGPTPAPVPSPSRSEILEPPPWLTDDITRNWLADYVRLVGPRSAPPAPSSTDVIGDIIVDVGEAVAPTLPGPSAVVPVLPAGEFPH